MLHDVCTVCIEAFRVLTIYLKPVLPALAAQVEGFLKVAPMSFADASRALGRHAIGEYKHLMQRVDHAAARRSSSSRPDRAAAARRREPVAAHHQSTTSPRSTCASPDRRLRTRRVEGSDKLLRLTLDVGEGRTRNVFSGITSAYQPEAAGRQVHRDGRQPGAAQDEVRRQRRHGAGRQPRRREGHPGSTSSSLAGRDARACACAEPRRHARRPGTAAPGTDAPAPPFASSRPPLRTSAGGPAARHRFRRTHSWPCPTALSPAPARRRAAGDHAASSRDIAAGLTVGVVTCRWRWPSPSPAASNPSRASSPRSSPASSSRPWAARSADRRPGRRLHRHRLRHRERYGLTNLLIATALSGVLLFTMGLLRLGALVRYIPVTIIIGFTNGIAVLIGLSQLKDLFGLKIAKLPADFLHADRRAARARLDLQPLRAGHRPGLPGAGGGVAQVPYHAAGQHRLAASRVPPRRTCPAPSSCWCWPRWRWPCCTAGGDHRQQVRRHPAGLPTCSCRPSAGRAPSSSSSRR